MQLLPGDDERRGTYSNNSIEDSAATEVLCLKAKQHHVAVILQHVLGICVAALLLAYQASCIAGALQAAAYIRQHAVKNQVQWLMGAPAGNSLMHLACSTVLELQHISRSHFNSQRKN